MCPLVASILAGIVFVPFAWSERLTDAFRMSAAQVPAGENWTPPEYRGRIVVLTEKAVTIKLEGVLKIPRISFHPDGAVKEEQLYLQDNNQPPKEFVFTQDYLNDKWAGPPPRGFGHKISDLKVGDLVTVRCVRIGGVDHCAAVGIYRRPGGRVPPAVEPKVLPEDKRWHVLMNAAQAREERGAAALLRVGLRLIR